MCKSVKKCILVLFVCMMLKLTLSLPTTIRNTRIQRGIVRVSQVRLMTMMATSFSSNSYTNTKKSLNFGVDGPNRSYNTGRSRNNEGTFGMRRVVRERRPEMVENKNYENDPEAVKTLKRGQDVTVEVLRFGVIGATVKVNGLDNVYGVVYQESIQEYENIHDCDVKKGK